MLLQPTPPSPPSLPAPAAPRTELLVGVPRTAREMTSLRQIRTELSNQLNSAADRREQLVRQLGRTDPAAREGVQARIQLLDQRILQLESDIAATGRQVVAAPPGLLGSSSSPSRSFPVNGARVDYTAIAMVFTLAVFMPMALAFARMIWKRTTTSSRVKATGSSEDSQRLMRLEQAVDTIAVEVERISEGQRFVTQLLADGTQPARLLESVPGAGRER